VIRLIVKLALLTMVGLGSLVWLIVIIGQLGGPAGMFADTHELTAEFTDATGVVPGDEVRMAGVPIGKVGGVEADRGKAVVELQIDDQYPVPEGSRFELHWRNLLGQRYVQVVPPPDADPDGAVMAAGERVGTDRTGAAADLTALLETAEPLFSSLDTATMNRVMTTLAAALQGREDTVGRMISDSTALLATLDGRAEAIGSTIESFGTVVDGLAKRDADIQRLLDGLADASTALAGQSESLAGAMENSSEVLHLVDEVLAANDGDIDVVLTQLSQLAGALGESRDDLAEGIRTLPWTSAALIRATNQGDWLQVYGRGFGVINTFSPEPRVGPDYSDVDPDATGGAEDPLLGRPSLPILPPLPETELGPITVNPSPGREADQSSGLDRLLAPVLGARR
jgi:phospholipid/cholesterol/gamma-HCH transport system substrate-binding protein